MADYHHVYETPEKEDTEWDAIQRRLGNLPAKPKKKPPPAFKPTSERVLDEEAIDGADEDALEDWEDDFEDDRFLEAYRQKRLAELSQQQQQRRSEFGEMTEITGTDFVKQVTETSAHAWVIVLLYEPRHLKCAELEKCLIELAGDFPYTKFVKILSEECIPGYPRHHLPTLLVYHERSCKKNLVGTAPYREGRILVDHVVEALNAIGPVCQ